MPERLSGLRIHFWVAVADTANKEKEPNDLIPKLKGVVR